MFLSSITLNKWKRRNASLWLVPTSSPQTLVLVLCTAHPGLVMTITRHASRMVSLSKVKLQYQLILMESSQIKLLTLRASTLKMLIIRSRKDWRMKEDLSHQAQLSIVIPIAGDQILLSFTEHLIPGSSKLLKLKSNWLKTTRTAHGFLLSFRKKDSTTGLLMQKTGASQEIDTGATPFQFGPLTTWKKSYALVQSKNLESFLVVGRSLTCIEKILTRSLFHQRRAKVF